MESYYSISAKAAKECVVALGCFDGVHAGHIKLIEEARKIAVDKNLATAIWSFSEPPRNFFTENKIPLLTTAEEKRDIMNSLGVDIFVSVPFNEEISEMSAEDFFYTVLLKNMKAKHIVCGFNYRFGKKGAGNADVLKELCDKNKISLSVISPVKIDEITVSSSEIRSALENGNIERANAFLTRSYAIYSPVIDGQHLGRKLGFPTVNQAFPPFKAVPKRGVYLSQITFGNTTKHGITNIGLRPTVGADKIYAETNIFDFEENLYGTLINVELLHFLREERKFATLEELTEQVHHDITTAKEILNK